MLLESGQPRLEVDHEAAREVARIGLTGALAARDGRLAGVDALAIAIGRIHAALVQSDNLAANALAIRVGETLGSAAPAESNSKITAATVFVAQMNALAKQLGMDRTRFVNPSGFDYKERPMPYSTAIDLARLTRYAMNKASFRFYVSQKEREISFNRGGKQMHALLRTTNDLLGTNGIDGVKTGQTARAGECLILSANRAAEVIKNGDNATIFPRHLIVVILGSSDRFGDGERLVPVSEPKPDPTTLPAEAFYTNEFVP
jgi:D-alanyl-D-alanine carboxypeptidase